VLIEQAANAAGLTADGSFEGLRACGLGRGVREIPLEPVPAAPPAAPFANDSEAEFAKVLDFYRIPWQYEPAVFPIEWWPDGRVRSSFSPDFYLPELDTYLELTTMRVAGDQEESEYPALPGTLPDKKLLISTAATTRGLPRSSA
jgi:hypothetical protein